MNIISHPSSNLLRNHLIQVNINFFLKIAKRHIPSRRRTRSSDKLPPPKKRHTDVERQQWEELDERRREAQRILTLDDPKEQYHCFLEMVTRPSLAVSRRRHSRSRSRSWSRGRSKSPVSDLTRKCI